MRITTRLLMHTECPHFYANYRFHPQTEWMTEREAQNPGAQLYAHWMQTTHLKAHEALDRTRESMNKYYDPKA